VTDLLLNWDVYLQRQQTIQAIQPPKGAGGGTGTSPWFCPGGVGKMEKPRATRPARLGSACWKT